MGLAEALTSFLSRSCEGSQFPSNAMIIGARDTPEYRTLT